MLFFTIKTTLQLLTYNLKNMNKRDRGDRSGGRRDGGRFNDRDSKQMHDAICADCGDSCQVPFKPRGDRPIYCNRCMDKHRSGDDRRDRGNFRNHSDRRMFKAICDSCGKQCELPFRPTEGKPVYCSDCFGDKGGRSDRSKPASNTDNAELKAQIKSLHLKIDKILSVVAPTKVHEIPYDDKSNPEKKSNDKNTVKKTQAEKESKPAKKSTKAKKSAKKTTKKKASKSTAKKTKN